MQKLILDACGLKDQQKIIDFPLFLYFSAHIKYRRVPHSLQIEFWMKLLNPDRLDHIH